MADPARCRAAPAARAVATTMRSACCSSRHRERLWAVALRTLGDPEEAGGRAAGRDDLGVPPGRRASAAIRRSPPGCTASSSTPAWTGSAAGRPAPGRQRAGRARRWMCSRPRLARAGPGGRQRHVARRARRAAHAPARTSGRRWSWWTCSATRWPTAAEILGISAGTVKSRCARGRARLLPLLAHLRGSPLAAAARPGPAGRAAEPASRCQRVSPAEGAGESQA